jgi:hypothetical protein
MGSVDLGTAKWSVVELDPFSTMGVCHTATVAVFAASAEPANASVAAPAAATSAARKAFFMFSVPFV